MVLLNTRMLDFWSSYYEEVHIDRELMVYNPQYGANYTGANDVED